MIRYLVSNNPYLIINAGETTYSMITVSDALSLLYKERYIALDIETTGLDPHTEQMTLCQFGNENYQIAVDTLTVNIRFFAKLLEDKDKLFILQNGKFDIQFFYKVGIVVQKIFDTFIAEKLLYLGYPTGYRGFGLDDLCFNYLEIVLDKSERKRIIKKISPNSIIYGCNDVRYLIPIMKIQLEELGKKELLTAIRFENAFVRVLAYVEYCGIKLDRNLWTQRIINNQKKLEETITELNNWVLEYKNPKYIDMQLDAFRENIVTNINWNSPQQVIPLFEELGFKLETLDKKTKKVKKSVGEKIISKQINISSLAPIYIKFKKISKDLNAFGQNFLDEINPETNKIHTNFTQLVDTSRLSSGSDDDENIKTVNIQNIPQDANTRACFIAEEGDLLIDVDYHAQEDFIFTEMSREKKLIEFYNDKTNKRDGHAFVAKMCFPQQLQDIPELEIADKFPNLRKIAKSVKFSIHYGGNGNTIAENAGVTPEEGNEIEKQYLTNFPDIKAYFDKVLNETLKNGYILLNKKLGHKRFIYGFNEFENIGKKLTKDFWTEYRKEKELDSIKFHEELKPIVKKYFKMRETIKKNSYNSPVQGTAAMMTKMAAMYIFNDLEKSGLLFKVKIHNLVHDEILVGAPKELAEPIAKMVVDNMVKASNYFVTVVQMSAKPLIGNHWVH